MKTYIGVVVLVFLVAVSFLIFPRQYPDPASSASCAIGEAPREHKTIIMPAIKGMESKGDDEGGPDLSTTSQFELIRVNVPIQNVKRDRPVKIAAIFEGDAHTKKYTQANIPGFEVYYPASAGEVSLDHKFKSVYGGLTDQFRFRQEGFIFFVHLNPDGSILVKGDNYYTVDIYQDVRRFQDSGRGYTLDEVFRCQGGISGSTEVTRKTNVTIPAQSSSLDHQQLQLQYFMVNPQVGGFNAHCKPAIYLYPPKVMDINVKVNTKGFLTYTDPPYPDGGWNVVANPNGLLKIQDTRYKIQDYNYLYYESKIPDNLINPPTDGFTVSFSELPGLYESILPKLGLNAEQTKDFSDYWTKALPYSPYYFVGVMDQKNINEFEPLDITPKPDTLNRVRLYFKAVDKKPGKTVMGGELLVKGKITSHQSPITNQFNVVEWGGMFKADPLHPFTCSQ